MADWWWTVQLDDYTYPAGTAGFARWDPATVWETPGAPPGPTLDASPWLVALPAGIQIDYAAALVDWTPWGVPYTAGLQIVDSSMSVLVDVTFTESTPGTSGFFSQILPSPYTMPSAGFLRGLIQNDSATGFTTYSGVPSLVLEIGWSSPPTGRWRTGRVGWAA